MAYGDGSVGKRRRKDGRYQGSISVAGKRVYVYGDTPGQVRSKLATLRRQREDGTAPPAPQTVAEWLAEWLASVTPALRPRTVVGYDRMIRRQIVPHLGAVRLRELSPRQIRQMETALLATLSPQSVHHVHRLLSAALAAAHRDELIDRNPVTQVRPPRVPKHEARVLSAEEATRLLAACAGDRLDALYVLALTTGMRAGELCGLRWQDVDLTRGVVTVRMALVYVSRTLSLAETKTASSQRALPLTALAHAALLRRWDIYTEERKAQGWQEHGVCFPRPDGTYLSPKAFRYGFNKILARAELTGLTPHELRHTAATFMLAAGVNLKAVSGTLGHSRVGITADLYAALTPEMLESGRDAMQRLLGGGDGAG